MKVKNVFNQLFNSVYKKANNNTQVLSPINKYDPNNVTRDEFQAYVHYLANNKVNKTFIEPAKFITDAERAQRKTFRDRVHYLAENNINLTFYC